MRGILLLPFLVPMTLRLSRKKESPTPDKGER